MTTSLRMRLPWLMASMLGLGCAGAVPDGGPDASSNPTDAQVALDAGEAAPTDASPPPDDAASMPTALDETPLGMLARSMEPGSWASLETEMPDDLMTVETDPETGRRLHIAGWTDDAHWDPDSAQVLYLGFRLETKMIAFEATSNAWRVLPTFEWPEGVNNRGHVYGLNGHDPATGTFYHAVLGTHLFSFDVATETWTRRTSAPARGGIGASIEYFPEMNGVLRYYRYEPMYGFDPATEAWTELQDATVTETVHGWHTLLRYHPRRGEVIAMGGTDTPRAVARIGADGSFTPIAGTPFDLDVRDDYLLAHPVTDHFVLFRDGFSAAYDYDPDTGVFTEHEDFTNPWSTGEMPISATIPELGVIFFVDRTGVRLYRPRAL